MNSQDALAVLRGMPALQTVVEQESAQLKD
jgi:hypothetical protein